MLTGVELWDADLLCVAGACLSSLGEAAVGGAGEGLKGEVKRCGGQLGVLRGGTGGRDVSKVVQTRGQA